MTRSEPAPTAPAAGGSPPGRRFDADTRRRMIVDASARLFGRRPYDQVTTKQLAEAAGVSQALLFHHFGSKQDLYAAVVEAGVDGLTDALHGILTAAIELPEASVERIEQFFRDALGSAFADPGLLRSFLTEPKAEEARRTYYRVLLDREAEMLGTLEEARRRGVLPDLDPRVLLRALITQPVTFVITEEWLGGKDLAPIDLDSLPGELARLWASVLRSAPAAGGPTSREGAT